MVFNIKSMDYWDFYFKDGYVYNCQKTVKATNTK